ncbi:hypothetical protein D3C87_737060 [compost metagenome]
MRSEYHKVQITNYNIVRRYVGFLMDEYMLVEEVHNWLEANCNDLWYYDDMYGNSISFKDEKEALLFKLTWGGA